MRNKLISSLAGAAFSFAASGLAFAADMAVKAPPPAPVPAPVYSWTGFYLGASVGGRWSDVGWTTTSPPPTPAPSLTGPSTSFDSATARVGGYLGYNWQLSQSWVVGLEGDIAWGDSSKSNAGFPGLCFDVGCGTFDTITVKEGWDGSIRGRIGFLVTPTWLVYATGGAAWQQVSINAFCNGTPTNASYCDIAIGNSTSTVRSGWTIGGGVEAMLWGNGNIRFTFPPAHLTGFTSTVGLKTNTALVGLGYKF
jgi:outer membrane immunogenic protein